MNKKSILRFLKVALKEIALYVTTLIALVITMILSVLGAFYLYFEY